MDYELQSLDLIDLISERHIQLRSIMLHFNMQFKESVMREYEITNEKHISLHHVCRMISKAELMELIEREAKVNAHCNSSIYLSYPSSIELKDGCFIWNKEKVCYDAVINKSKPLQEKY